MHLRSQPTVTSMWLWTYDPHAKLWAGFGVRLPFGGGTHGRSQGWWPRRPATEVLVLTLVVVWSGPPFRPQTRMRACGINAMCIPPQKCSLTIAQIMQLSNADGNHFRQVPMWASSMGT